ncbi:THAP domain-containing protein 1-like [Aphis craccivora]|uniref:THAP domain-containing protein 1-like n=1 Tax=Aphis craccivora TaxID=307492 RepID=A0A6G0X6B2_APHCR|nr:THAP domain-containing protein 1-like [Aphis craccivora]
MPTKNACVLCLRSVYKNPGLSLFGFPKDPKRLKIWLMKCGLIEGDVQSNRKLCSFHFVETDFSKGVKRRFLKSNAIPTIFDEDHLRHETLSTSFERRVEENVSKDLQQIDLPEILCLTEDKEISTMSKG